MDIYFYNIISNKDINVRVYIYKNKQHDVNMLFSKINKYSNIKNINNYKQTKLSIKLEILSNDLDDLFFNLDKEKVL